VSLADYIQALKQYRGLAGDIVRHQRMPAREPVFAPPGLNLNRDLSGILKSLGIKQLYSHQKKAVDMITSGIHTVIATPTASGKSLVYNLPIIQSLIQDQRSHALYLFPLKALARDQMSTVHRLLEAAGKTNFLKEQLTAAVYDGDISAYQKSKIRRAPPHILLSNPEMLHLALLAHHHLWEDFFRNLKFVVIDEVHTYRGVMGSNMAWVFRRLRRICRLYGADPVFIFCSATIANPAGLTRRLTGLDVSVVDESGAPAGKKEVILMRGLEGAAQTAIALIHSAIHRNLRVICYTQSRKITELIAMWASRRATGFSDKITAYRAGFLPEERRAIERKLASGELLAVVSTSALELGIDIGNLDLCILVGYPGTIMSTWQRAGRVGRDGKDSAMILIAHEDALDQYYINHPDVFFRMEPERAIINPKNKVILKKHLECAAAELRLSRDDPFLGDSDIQEAVAELEHSARLLRSLQGDIWVAARKSPHREVSLRGTGKSLPIFLEGTRHCLGEIDHHRSYFETHEGAVYLHRGETFVITRFDHEKGIVEAVKKEERYFTKALSSKSTTIIRETDSCRVNNTRIGFGTLKIIEQVTGYDRRLVAGQKSIGIVPLDLPELEFETQGLWIEIPDRVRDTIESRCMHFMGGIHALEHAGIGIMPLLVMTDRNDLGGISIPYHSQVGRAAVFIYDGVPGGLGFALQAFKHAREFLGKILDVIVSCPCETGCPACVHSPKCGSGNRPIDKASSIRILEMMLFGTTDDDGAPVKEISINKGSGTGKKFGVHHELDRVSESLSQFDSQPRSQPGKPGNIRYGVLDVETRRSAKQVGGWNRASKMGVSCAILYNCVTDLYQEYLQEDIEQLCDDLMTFDLIIGFNIIGFDYKVLSGLCDFDFLSLPTLDILERVHKRLGYRLSLDHLASQTLNSKKSADGLMALKWWEQGEIQKIIDYCKQDVQVTRDLYRYGRENRFLVFKNKAGHQVRLPVDW
jgi:DEAD/DEAH box helicase domain-containing protein